MRSRIRLIVVAFASVLFSSGALAQEGCPAGSYSVVLTPEGGTLTILFDNFDVEAGGQTGAAVGRAVCRIHAPLQLPPNTSIGVYKVDYRGFALVEQRQRFELEVVYGFNDGRDHSYRRQIPGRHSADFVFSQTLGAGLIRRVGCGETAALDIEATITVNANNEPGFTTATLDTLDGAPRGGLVYYFEYRSCR